MISKDIIVNGTTFRLTLTDQVINHVNNLKSLSYEDPEISSHSHPAISHHRPLGYTKRCHILSA